MKNMIMKLVLMLSLVSVSGMVYGQNTWYTRSGAAASFDFTALLTNWTNQSDGSDGSNPTSYVLGDNWVILSGKTVTLNSSTPQIRSLEIQTGGTFNNSTNTLKFIYSGVSGGTLNINGGTYNANSGTLQFDGFFATDPVYTITSSNGTSQTFNNISVLDQTGTNSSLNFQSTNGAQTYTIGGTLSIRSATTNITTPSVSLAYGINSNLEYDLDDLDRDVGGEWTASLTPSNVIVDVGTGTVTLPDETVSITDDLTLTAGNLACFDADNILNVGGNVTAGTVSTSGFFSQGVLRFIGNQSQSIVGGLGSIANLTIEKTNSTDVVNVSSGTLTVDGDMVIKEGIFEIGSGATAIDLTGASLTVEIGGTYRTGGKTITGSPTYDFQFGSTIEFNGTTEETTPSGLTSVGNLIMNNTGGLKIVGSTVLLVKQTLTFSQNAVITTGGSNGDLLMSSRSGAFSGQNSSRFVFGPLRWAINENNESTVRTFPIGSSATDYTPATFQYTGSTAIGAGDSSIVELRAFETSPGGTTPTGVASISASFHYTLFERKVGVSISGLEYSITLNTENTGFSPNSRNTILRQNGASTYAVLSTSASDPGTEATATGVTAFPTNGGKLAFGDGGTAVAWDGDAADGLWTSPSNWQYDALPGSLDDVVLDNSLEDESNVTVTLDGTTAYTINSLQVGDDDGDNTYSIVLNITNTNTTPLTLLSNTGNVLNVKGDGTLTINGTSGGVILSNNGAINFDAGATYNLQTGSGITTDGTRTYANSSTTNISSTNGSALKSATYGVLNLTHASGIHSVTGNVSVQGDFTMSGNGNVTINGALDVDQDLGKSGSGTLTVNDGLLNIDGDLTLTEGTITSSGSGRIVVDLTTTISSGCILNVNGTNVAGNNFSGDVENAGTMNLNTSAVSVVFDGYSGGGNLNASGSTPNVTFNSNFSPTGSTTFGSQTLTFSGNVNLNGGTFTPSTSTTIQSGDLTIGAGSIANAGTLTFSSGEGDQTATFGTATINNLIVNKANGTNLNLGTSVLTVDGTLTLTAGNINHSGTLTVDAVSGGSGSSYVNGSLGITGSGTKTFPIGSESEFRPAQITNTSDATTAVSYSSNRYAGRTTSTSNVSKNRTWTATGGLQASSQMTMRYIAGSESGSDGIQNTATLLVVSSTSVSGLFDSRGQQILTTLLGVSAIQSNNMLGASTEFFTFGSAAPDNSLPVELASVEARNLFDGVRLTWETETETDNAGFYIMRKAADETDYQIVNSELVKSLNANSSQPQAYEFVDKVGLVAKTDYSYRIRSVDLGGAIHDYELTTEVTFNGAPNKMVLSQNYPNPFNPTTTFDVYVPEQANVTVEVYNMTGQKVKTIYNGTLEGTGSFIWDAKNDFGQSVSSGVYMYLVQTDKFREIKKMILMK